MFSNGYITTISKDDDISVTISDDYLTLTFESISSEWLHGILILTDQIPVITSAWNSNKLQYIVIDLGTISLDESGYYRINDNGKYPIYTKIVEISYYLLITPISAINIYRGENGGTYVFGSPNTEIQGLQIRCWYWQ